MRHLTAFVAAFLVTLALAGPAFGHVRLDHAEPKVGATVTASPGEVKLWFTDDVDLSGTTVEVVDASGNRVDQHDPHGEKNDKSVVIISLPQLPPGKYKVIWHALCLDQHTTKGEFHFDVRPQR